MSRALVAAALALAALAGCASTPPAPSGRVGAVYPPVVPARPRASLWPREPAAERRASFMGDPVARGRGDVVTVLVRESQRTSQREATTLEQSTEARAELGGLQGLPNAFRQGLPGGAVSSTRSFDATGDTNRDGSFEARVSVVVTDVQPNGNLVLEGAREVRVDDDVKLLRVVGIARPLDITIGNTILSEDLAEASITYEGDGPLSRNSSRGVVGTFVDFLWHHLWPF